jgi:hypothetical protein
MLGNGYGIFHLPVVNDIISDFLIRFDLSILSKIAV